MTSSRGGRAGVEVPGVVVDLHRLPGLDGLHRLPQRPGEHAAGVGLGRVALHGVEDPVAVRGVDALRADVLRNRVELLRLGPAEPHVDGDRPGERGHPEHPRTVRREPQHRHGGVAEALAARGGVVHDVVEQLLRLLALADRVADEQQVALPVDAVAGRDDGRRDLRQLRVEVAERVVEQDQVGLGGGQRLQVRRLARARVGHRRELLLVRREGVRQIVRDEPGVVGAGRDRRDDAQGQQVVQLSGAEHGDLLGLGLDLRLALEVPDGPGELPVLGAPGAHAGLDGAGGDGGPLGGAGHEIAVRVGGGALALRGGGSIAGRASGQQPADDGNGQYGL